MKVRNSRRLMLIHEILRRGEKKTKVKHIIFVFLFIHFNVILLAMNSFRIFNFPHLLFILLFLPLFVQNHYFACSRDSLHLSRQCIFAMPALNGPKIPGIRKGEMNLEHVSRILREIPENDIHFPVVGLVVPSPENPIMLSWKDAGTQCALNNYVGRKVGFFLSFFHSLWRLGC